MTSDAQKRATAKYDAAHTRQIKLKLNLDTDKDVLNKLDTVPNKQGYIKTAIRRDMGNDDRTVYGYPVKELVGFALSCRQQGITKDELHKFCTDSALIHKNMMDAIDASIQRLIQEMGE